MDHSEPTSVRAADTMACMQFLDADARVCAPLPAFARDPETLRQLYRRMVETRVFDKKAAALQRSGQLPRYTACLGQEAIVTAIAFTLDDDDTLVTAGHAFSVQYLRSVGLLDVLRYWSDALHDASARRQSLAHALKTATDVGRAPERRVVVAPGSDGVVEMPELAHLLRPAGRNGLPLVLIVPRYQWRLSSHSEDHRGLAARTLDAGVVSMMVDGNDVIAMHDALARGVEQARDGDGPLLIEAITCSLHSARCTDEAASPRSGEEIRAAWEYCPIRRLKRYLESRQLWNADEDEALLLQAGEQAAIAAHKLNRRLLNP